MRSKLRGFGARPAEQRYPTAVSATEQLLLVDEECATAVRTLRLNSREPDEDNEAFAAAQLLILEIQGLPAPNQIIAILDADLKSIFECLADVLQPLSSEETDLLVRRYAAGTENQISNLIVLLSQYAGKLNDETWQWLASLAMDKRFKLRGIAFKILNATDPQRFGRILATAGWSWQSDGDRWSNHYGSLALIAATSGLPFEQSISSIAPWLLPKAVALRGGLAADAQIAAEVLDAILFAPGVEVPDPGSDISVDRELRMIDPFSLSITVRPGSEDDPFATLRAQADPEKWFEIRRRAVDTAVSRVNAARLSGASLFLHTVDPSDFVPIIEHAPAAIRKWLEGANTGTSDFKRRVQLAEGVYLSLCEALLSWSPDQGATLWYGLRKALVTRYLGRAKIEEMIHMLFRASASEALREEQLSLIQTNTDQALFELAIAAAINGERSWLDRIIATDLASSAIWRRQRAGKLAGFTTRNSLPVSGAWSEGPEDLPTYRQRETAQWRHKEGCARHWWKAYWRSTSEVEAYAAWVLFLETVDRRAYVWMGIEEGAQGGAAPVCPRRVAHFHANKGQLRSVMNKQEKELDQQFLGRKTIDGICLWGVSN